MQRLRKSRRIKIALCYGDRQHSRDPEDYWGLGSAERTKRGSCWSREGLPGWFRHTDWSLVDPNVSDHTILGRGPLTVNGQDYIIDMRSQSPGDVSRSFARLTTTLLMGGVAWEPYWPSPCTGISGQFCGGGNPCGEEGGQQGWGPTVDTHWSPRRHQHWEDHHTTRLGARSRIILWDPHGPSTPVYTPYGHRQGDWGLCTQEEADARAIKLRRRSRNLRRKLRRREHALEKLEGRRQAAARRARMKLQRKLHPVVVRQKTTRS
ncbi:hypothetical protein C8R43DRAFT_962310 [Mycena crocata]|nr:hypothetical protein C8R43DRAFT_962310 [Mycena crocata]